VPRPKRKSRIKGRPKEGTTILERDPSLIKKICDAIRAGCYVETATLLQNIGYSTMRQWVARGRDKPDTVFGELFRELEKAVAQQEALAVSVIHLHAQGRPAEYERRPRRDSNGNILYMPDGKPEMEIVYGPEGKPIVIREEIRPTWQAAAWKLERKHPDRWSKFRTGPNPDAGIFEMEEESKKLPGTDVTVEHQERLYREVREYSMALEELNDDPFSAEEA
jgi:hypothetical protein